MDPKNKNAFAGVSRQREHGERGESTDVVEIERLRRQLKVCHRRLLLLKATTIKQQALCDRILQASRKIFERSKISPAVSIQNLLERLRTTAPAWLRSAVRPAYLAVYRRTFVVESGSPDGDFAQIEEEYLAEVQSAYGSEISALTPEEEVIDILEVQEEHIDVLRRTIRGLEFAVRERDEHIASLQESYSWRLTAPLRWVYRTLLSFSKPLSNW